MFWVKGLLGSFLVALGLFLQSCSPVKFNGSVPVQSSCSDCGGDNQKVIDFSVDPSTQGMDIVFVVDNSPSMTSDVGRLSAKFGSFISELEGRDWQSCFITTDAVFLKDTLLTTASGDRVVRPGPHSFDNVTSALANVPLQNEQLQGGLAGVEQAIASINEFINGSSRQYCLREKTAKAFIIISDEDELDDGWVSETSPYQPQVGNYPDHLKSELERHFSTQASIHLIGVLPGDQVCLDIQRNQSGVFNKQSGYFANRYSEAVRNSLGTQQSICADDYGDVLKNITEKIRRQVDSIELGCIGAIIERIDFSIGTPVSWEIDGSKVVFQNALQPGDQLRVVYKCVQ